MVVAMQRQVLAVQAIQNNCHGSSGANQVVQRQAAMVKKVLKSVEMHQLQFGDKVVERVEESGDV